MPTINPAIFPKKFTFHDDASHGWMQVPYACLEALGLQHKISDSSYRFGETVYLEEDRDKTLFVKTLYDLPNDIQNALPCLRNTQEEVYSHSSFIKDLPRYWAGE